MLTETQKNALADLARRHNWRLAVLFGSAAHGEGRDVDIAVVPAAMPDLREQAGWQVEVEEIVAPKPLDLLVAGDNLSPVTRFEVFCKGACLYERAPGMFDREFDRAFFLYADSEKFRRALHEQLHETNA
jgi:predicted nucleotidyltransferase